MDSFPCLHGSTSLTLWDVFAGRWQWKLEWELDRGVYQDTVPLYYHSHGRIFRWFQQSRCGHSCNQPPPAWFLWEILLKHGLVLLAKQGRFYSNNNDCLSGPFLLHCNVYNLNLGVKKTKELLLYVTLMLGDAPMDCVVVAAAISRLLAIKNYYWTNSKTFGQYEFYKQIPNI